jgi:molybdopterin-containing oxidoreductase family membrane subunit
MKKGSLITQVVLAVLAILGVACWIVQLTQGLQLTNQNNFNTWGLYIISFMLFTGVAAGCLIFTASTYLFKRMEEFKPFARITAYIALCGVVAAGLFIFVDLGNPQRAWRILTGFRLSSPMLWDTVILLAFVIVGVLLTRQIILVQEGKKKEQSLRTISIVSFITGLFVMGTSFVFAMQVARPLWNNPVEPVSFLAAALVVALSLLIIVLALLNDTGRIKISSDRLGKMGKLAGVFLLFELFVVVGEVFIGLYAGAGDENQVIQWMVAGKGAPFFWVELIAIVVGLVLSLMNSSKMAVIVTGASVSIFAIFMIKYNLLQSQLLNPLLRYAGPPGYNISALGAYLPSPVEIGTTIGIIAIGGLLALIGFNKLNLGASPEVG